MGRIRDPQTRVRYKNMKGTQMPLTPADVHNVAFSKPPIGKRGYNEDEVDQFLDLVEDLSLIHI